LVRKTGSGQKSPRTSIVLVGPPLLAALIK
jgi:hypothetical protein